MPIGTTNDTMQYNVSTVKNKTNVYWALAAKRWIKQRFTHRVIDPHRNTRTHIEQIICHWKWLRPNTIREIL